MTNTGKSESMVDRVARAIALAHLDPDTRAAVDPKVWYVAESYFDLARTAINAMREPTKLMWAAGTSALEDKRDWSQDSYQCYEITDPSDQAIPCFQAMIDAALKE